MTKYLTATILYVLLFFNSRSQTVENTINLYGVNFPAEKIYIHFDKEAYLPGETIWFKAYVFVENEPGARSTNFYISLYDDSGKALQQKIYPVTSGSTEGHFDIPDSINTSQLICRAYTSWMLNFDDDFLFTKAIPLYGNKITKVADKKPISISLNFFPEGGDIIEGERNSIAFKANYGNGLPFEISGAIKKQETGEVLMPLRSVHDGMGRFDIIPQPNEKYYAEWMDNNGQLQLTYLPERKIAGVSVKLVQQKSKLIYNVVNKLATDNLHVLAYMYQKIIYRSDLSMPSGDRFTGYIPLDSFPSGVLQLTVFNDNWQPVAERICFVNNTNYTAEAHIIYKQVSLEKRKKNTIEINMGDTVPANLSLSITDADFNNADRSNNIITGLLLNGDIRGYIHNPAYYFADDKDSSLRSQIDLVMLTHGWRRYNWDNVRSGKMPPINFPQDNYLSLYGQVSEAVVKKIAKDEMVNLLVRTKDSTSNFYLIRPDEKGLLKMAGLIFYDTAKIYYSFNTNKQYNKQMAFSTFNNSLIQPLELHNYFDHLSKDTAGTSLSPVAAFYKYNIADKANLALQNIKTLESVVIKSGGWHNWKNTPIVKLDERYATGMFSSGGNSFAFDVLHDDQAWGKIDIFNYMTGKVPGLSVGYPRGLATGMQRSFVYNQLTNEMGSNGVLVFIDERQVEISQLEMTSVSDIAYIKFIPQFMGSVNVDAGTSIINPALCVYLKKGDDMIDRRPKLTDPGIVKVVGYSPVKEFYSPDYSQTVNMIGNDSRSTLLWVPYIFTKKNYTTVPISFYNNDFSKKIKIVLEGVNDEGKLIHVERIIQ